MTTVSVVLPTYNRAFSTSRAINSVLDQTNEDFELIVVDDNSDDNTKEVVSKYGNKIKYIRHETNRGASAARNTGIEESKGDYIAFIDSDDEWHPEKLERQVSVFSRASSKVGVVYTGFYKQFSEKRELGKVPTKRGDIFEAQLMKDWVNPTSTVMVRSECFERVGGFNNGLPARQDYELWIRLSRHYHFDYIQEPLVTMHVDSNNRITDDIDARMEAHSRVLESIRSDIRSLPWHKRRRVLSMQYFTLGRHLQKHREFTSALTTLGRSIQHNPLNWKAYGALMLTLLRRDTQSDTFINLKNFLRKAWNE